VKQCADTCIILSEARDQGLPKLHFVEQPPDWLGIGLVESEKAPLCTHYGVWIVIYNNLAALNYFAMQVSHCVDQSIEKLTYF
jgi:hypothetical protein